jgi:hypothetical protein
VAKEIGRKFGEQAVTCMVRPLVRAHRSALCLCKREFDSFVANGINADEVRSVGVLSAFVAVTFKLPLRPLRLLMSELYVHNGVLEKPYRVVCTLLCPTLLAGPPDSVRAQIDDFVTSSLDGEVPAELDALRELLSFQVRGLFSSPACGILQVMVCTLGCRTCRRAMSHASVRTVSENL